MFQVTVNGEAFRFKTSKETTDAILKAKAAYLSHPYFFNLDKIKHYQALANNAKSWEAVRANRNKSGKLEDERRKFLLENSEMLPPDPLKISICQTS